MVESQRCLAAPPMPTQPLRARFRLCVLDNAGNTSPGVVATLVAGSRRRVL